MVIQKYGLHRYRRSIKITILFDSQIMLSKTTRGQTKSSKATSVINSEGRSKEGEYFWNEITYATTI